MLKNMMKPLCSPCKFLPLFMTLTLTTLTAPASDALAVQYLTKEPPQMHGNTPNTSENWEVRPLITIGELTENGEDRNLKSLGYRPPGLLDGIGAFKKDKDTVRVLVNHELGASNGYPYQLKNGTELTGARVSYFDIHIPSRKITKAGLAFDTVYDRAGNQVVDPSQIHEGFASGKAGFDRFCSAYGTAKGRYGAVDNLYFAGEEVDDNLGGQETVLDVDKKDLYVAPMLGRAAFENVITLDPGESNKMVMMIGDDREGNALLLYIGQKGAAPSSGPYTPPQFLVKNGLGLGNLYVWVADNGDVDPSQFKGTSNSRTGKFVKIKHFDPSLAGVGGYDNLGFASQTLHDTLANAIGAFRFSRPEDLATNPENGNQVVFASTGRSALFGGADSWGTTYIIDVKFDGLLNMPLASIDNIPTDIKIIYDGDDAGNGQFAGPDFGLRSPDNLDWADDGKVYIQEDDAFSGFGLTSGIEASMWKLNPANGKLTRILEIDRSAIPTGQTDSDPTDIGDWESSGVLDITHLFGKKDKDDKILILDTQPHSLRGDPLGGANRNQDLVEGGQLILLTRSGKNKD